MAEIKVLMVMTDAVNEPTLREFLRLGGYSFSTAYLQMEAEVPPIPTGSQNIPVQPTPGQEEEK